MDDKDLIGETIPMTTPQDVKRENPPGMEYVCDHDRVVTMLSNHFGNPYTRCCRENRIWKRCPYKMVLLLLKLAFVTAQLYLFAHDRSRLVHFLDRNNVALKHLLLQDWDSSHETMPYPPSTGLYAIYDIQDLHEHIDHAVNQLYSVPTLAVGSFFLDRDNPVTLCVTYYKKGMYYHKTGEIEIDPTTLTKCKTIEEKHENNYGFDPSIQELMRSTNGTLVRLLNVRLQFRVLSVHVDVKESIPSPECFRISGLIEFQNNDIEGQIPVELRTSIEEFKCNHNVTKRAGADDIALGVIVFILVICSMVGSFRSFKKSVEVLKDTKIYFSNHNPSIDGVVVTGLSARGQWEILKIRDVVIIVSDMCTIGGSCFKLALDSKSISSSSGIYDACGILIGTGCLLVWLGVLHYLSYDSKFSLLFRVMERAGLQVMRFLSCVVMLFIGFSLCGWVALGPYHIKFQDMSSSFQCLISLLAGDELYMTYTAISGNKEAMWWFNTIFITVFYLVFTIVAINIFIAIFTTTYEVIFEKNDKSDLKRFMEHQKESGKTVLPDTCQNLCCFFSNTAET